MFSSSQTIDSFARIFSGIFSEKYIYRREVNISFSYSNTVFGIYQLYQLRVKFHEVLQKFVEIFISYINL